MRLGAVLAGVGVVGALVSSVAVGSVISGGDPVPLGGGARPRADRSHPVPSAVSARVVYRPPVSSPILEGYRPPVTPYGPGNRGIDYRTSPGQAENAAADGVVSFAGQVGGTLHVTVRHADGVRTSYSFLGTVGVRTGQWVRLGQSIGAAGERPLHLGARRGTRYFDPRTLFADDRFTVRLVPARRDP